MIGKGFETFDNRKPFSDFVTISFQAKGDLACAFTTAAVRPSRPSGLRRRQRLRQPAPSPRVGYAYLSPTVLRIGWVS